MNNVDTTIQNLIKYIDDKKKLQATYQKEYNKLAKNFTPVELPRKKLLDNVFPSRYQKNVANYKSSEKTKKELEELDKEILMLQIDIENLLNYLCVLQSSSSSKITHKSNKINDKINESTFDNR